MRRFAVLAIVAGCNDWGSGIQPAPLRSMAARGPAWGGDAPQLANLETLFLDSAPRTVAALHDGLLACRVEAAFDARDLSPPDLGVRLTVGKTFHGNVRTPASNAWDGIVAWPGVDLVVGQELTLMLWDEDTLTRSDHIATLSTRFTGELPLVLGSDDATAECRPIDQAQLRDQLAEARVRGAAALDMLAREAPPDVATGRLARPAELVEEARIAMREIAAIAGWEEPGLRAQVVREQALERTWNEQLRQHIDQLAASLPPAGTAVPIPAAGVTLAAALDCDAGQTTCVVTYDLAPLAGAGPVERAGRLRTQLVTRDGLAINPGPAEVDERTTATDGHVRVRFRFSVAARYQPTLHLARVTIYGQPTRAVRVR